MELVVRNNARRKAIDRLIEIKISQLFQERNGPIEAKLEG